MENKTDKTEVDLLAPRYKVIADYPNSPFAVGQVLNLKEVGGFWRYEWYNNAGMEYETESYFNEYSHLFKKLSWWEDRKVEDMPEYVTSNGGTVNMQKGEVFKARNWDDFARDIITCQIVGFSDFFAYKASELLPATEQEYITYINNQSK